MLESAGLGYRGLLVSYANPPCRDVSLSEQSRLHDNTRSRERDRATLTTNAPCSLGSRAGACSVCSPHAQPGRPGLTGVQSYEPGGSFSRGARWQTCNHPSHHAGPTRPRAPPGRGRASGPRPGGTACRVVCGPWAATRTRPRARRALPHARPQAMLAGMPAGLMPLVPPTLVCP